jgi:hypothetical protein
MQFDLRNGQRVKLETCVLQQEQQSREKYYILKHVIEERRLSFNYVLVHRSVLYIYLHLPLLLTVRVT